MIASVPHGSQPSAEPPCLLEIANHALNDVDVGLQFAKPESAIEAILSHRARTAVAKLRQALEALAKPSRIVGYLATTTGAFIAPELFARIKADLPDSPQLKNWKAVVDAPDEVTPEGDFKVEANQIRYVGPQDAGLAVSDREVQRWISELGTRSPAASLREADLASACLSYRHDFGLMEPAEQQELLFTAKEWARAFGLLDRPAAAAAVPSAESASIRWPKDHRVGRRDDMSATGKLEVMLDNDGDVIVHVCKGDTAEKWESASVEFCAGGSGGGRSHRTRVALINLMVAMEADNAESPHVAASAGRGRA